MKKIIIALCVVICVFAIGWNSYQSERQNVSGKKKVYAILPLTGGLSFQGKEEKKTIEAWMQNHPNAPFDLEILDNESNATKSLTLAQRVAMSDKQPLFIVPTVAMAHPILPQLKAMNGFLILFATQEEDGTYKEFQRVSFGGDDMNKPMFDFVKKGQSVVIIHSNDMAGHADADKSQKVMAEKGANVIEKLAFDTSSLDMRILVLKAISFNPDVIFITSPPTIGYMNIIRELKAQEYSGTILAGPSITIPSIIGQLKNAADGMYTSILPTERIYEEYPHVNKALTENGLALYWAPICFWDIMDVVNHFVANNISFTQEEFMKMGKWHGISSDIKFMSNGNSAYEFILSIVKDGKFVPIDESDEK